MQTLQEILTLLYSKNTTVENENEFYTLEIRPSRKQDHIYYSIFHWTRLEWDIFMDGYSSLENLYTEMKKMDIWFK